MQPLLTPPPQGRALSDELAAALAAKGPFAVLDALALRYRREGRAARLSCLFHDERTPSATFRVGRVGSLQFYCHGACGRSWDVHAVVARVRGLDPRRDFRAVLAAGAELAGRWDLVEAIRGPVAASKLVAATAAHLPAPRPAATLEERAYPPEAEVDALWASCLRVGDDHAVAELLTSRGLDWEAVELWDVARALPPDIATPRWARYGGRSWARSGHRLVVPMFDALGRLRSVRAWRVAGDGGPKRLPPAGHRASGLVMACPLGRRVLRTGSKPPESEGRPLRLAIVEGEPDFLTWTTRLAGGTDDDTALWGVVSRSWSPELARRVPDGTHVAVLTHDDGAGERYAREIIASLADRCVVRDRRRARV